MTKPTIPAHIREQQINELQGVRFLHWDGGYRGIQSKAVCRCAIDGYEWSVSVNNLLNLGRGCPACAGQRRWTADERIGQINALPNIRFVRWEGECRNNTSKAVCRCIVDGYEWSASVHNLLKPNGTGCPDCTGKRRWTADERILQINKLGAVRFIRWDGEYHKGKSKATVRCDNGHEWSTSVSSLVHQYTGCPQCAEYGYNPSKPGTLYALRSECGTMVKIGISNNYEQRHRQLTRATPFSWSCVELIHGDGATIAALEKAFHGMTESVSFDEPFDGHTEWCKWTPELVDWFNTWREMT